MADDLNPAAVERAARAAFVASALPEHRRYAETYGYDSPDEDIR